MLIDWFTVAAQIINFLLLVWLLKRFLYRPILEAIDAREQKIAAALAAAQASQAEAAAERDAFERKCAELAQQQAALLQAATAEAQAQGRRLLDATRQEAELLRRKHQAALQREARSLHEALSEQTRRQVFAIARKALTDLADTSLEARMVAVLLARLQALSDEERLALRHALHDAARPLQIRTSAALPADLRKRLEDELHRLLGDEVVLQFDTRAEAGCGIELRADGQRLAWSLEAYLAELEGSVDALLASKMAAPTKQEAEDGS